MSSAILKRGVPGYDVQDTGALANLEYNNAAGGQKILEVGRHLVPIQFGGAYITDLSTSATSLPGLGKNLAIYNNSSSLASITLGEDSTITSLAPGVTDASGHVGIALSPNAWTYVACGYKNWAITSASTVIVYLIYDNTSIKPQSSLQAIPYNYTNT